MRTSVPECAAVNSVRRSTLIAEHSMAIGLGANLGDPVEQLCAARTALVSALAPMGWHLWACSSLYETEPWETQGPTYINAVTVWSGTPGDPHEVLERLQSIEQGAGRTRPYRYAPRTLDLDLLWCGTACIDTPILTVPHPRMWERAFVVVPLAEVVEAQHSMDPVRWRGPLGGWSAAAMATTGQAIQRVRASAWEQ